MNNYFDFIEAKRLVDFLYGDKSIDFLRSIVEGSLIKVEKQIGEGNVSGTITIEECLEGHYHYFQIRIDFLYEEIPIQKSLKAELCPTDCELVFRPNPLQEYEIYAALLVLDIDLKRYLILMHEFIFEDVIPEYELNYFLNHAILMKIEELSSKNPTSTEDLTSNKSKSVSKDGVKASS